MQWLEKGSRVGERKEKRAVRRVEFWKVGTVVNEPVLA
jgi:hypothetical protein